MHINNKILYDYITFYDSKTCLHLLRHSTVGWQPGPRPQYSPDERKLLLDFGRSLKEKVERNKPNLCVVVSPVKDKVSARTSFQSLTTQCFLFALHLKKKTWGNIPRLNYWRRRRILNIKNEKKLDILMFSLRPSPSTEKHSKAGVGGECKFFSSTFA